VETRFKRKDGSVIDVLLCSSSIDPEDLSRGVILTALDVTELKQAERHMRESEQRYRSLFKDNHSVMLLIDPESANIVDANPAACSFYGWSREEITSMKITDINMLSREHVFQEMERAKSEERKHFFFKHRLATEEIRDVEVYSGPIGVRGRKLLYSIIHDITERKRAEEALQKSEERYRHLVETMNEGLAMADQNYVFTYVNKTFCEMLGYSRDELIDHNLIEFIHDDNKEFMKTQMARRRMGEAKRFDLVWRAKNGHKIYTLVSPRGFLDAEGHFVGSLGVLTDITDRKQVEEALRKAHDRLEHRTTELVKLNRKMKQEIKERKLAEKELRTREAQLEINTNELEEVNTALRVLLKRRDDDKTEFEEKVLYNVKELIVPYLQRLKGDELDGKRRAYVSIIESNLNDIVSSFTHKLSSKYLGLTPTEIQIANLVKQGMTTKEIAEILNSSHRTVEFHRKNIRKKIGIVNRKVNLRSHLLSM
jgi:PAS domain S-box-containing protein